MLSPVIFNISIDYTMTKLQQVEGGLLGTEESIPKGLTYADDTCLIGEDTDGIIALTNTVNTEAIKLGLNINTHKTRSMKLMITDERSVTVVGQ